MFVDEGFQVGLDAQVVARLVLTPARAPQQETKQNLQYTGYSTGHCGDGLPGVLHTDDESLNEISLQIKMLKMTFKTGLAYFSQEFNSAVPYQREVCLH